MKAYEVCTYTFFEVATKGGPVGGNELSFHNKYTNCDHQTVFGPMALVSKSKREVATAMECFLIPHRRVLARPHRASGIATNHSTAAPIWRAPITSSELWGGRKWKCGGRTGRTPNSRRECLRGAGLKLAY